MLKLLILLSIMLWIHAFFGSSDPQESHYSGGSIYFLSMVIVVLIIVGFLS